MMLPSLQLFQDQESGRVFDSLFADFSLSEGKSLSKAERRRTGVLADKGLIYGEVSTQSASKQRRAHILEPCVMIAIQFVLPSKR